MAVLVLYTIRAFSIIVVNFWLKQIEKLLCKSNLWKEIGLLFLNSLDERKMIPYSKGVNILIFCFILLSFGCRLVLSNDSVNQINIRVERASTSDNGRDPRIVVATVIGNVLENATINTTVATVRVYDDVPGDKTKTNYR